MSLELIVQQNSQAIQKLVDDAKDLSQIPKFANTLSDADLLLFRIDSLGQTVAMEYSTFVTHIKNIKIDTTFPELVVTKTVVAVENTLGAFITNQANYTFSEGTAIAIISAPDVNGDTFSEHYLYNGGDKSLTASYDEFTAARIEWANIVNKPTNLETVEGAQTKADAKVEDQIVDGVLDKAPSQNAVFDALAGKQPSLVSGTNIKTVNGQSLLGSTDLVVTGGAASRTIKTLANTTQYTLIAADFTDFILEFTANASEEISIVLNAGVAPLNGELQMISTGNNKLVPSLTGVTATYPEQTNPKTILKGWLGGIVTATDTISFNGSLESTATGGTTYAPFTNTVDGLVKAPGVAGETTYGGEITFPTEGFTVTEGETVSVTASESAVVTGSDIEVVTTDFTGGRPWKKIKDIIKEHEINGTRITSDITGTYAIDWNTGSQFVLTPTGAVTLSNANLPVAPNTKVISGIFKASSFAVTFPASWKARANNDPLDATLDTHFTAETISDTVILYTLENIPA